MSSTPPSPSDAPNGAPDGTTGEATGNVPAAAPGDQLVPPPPTDPSADQPDAADTTGDSLGTTHESRPEVTQESPAVDPVPDTQAVPVQTPDDTWHLDWAAISDVGRVRKDNQDSGYAGPNLLAVCDGVGGAARGDIASSTAVGTLATLDQPPAGDLLDLVTNALNAAHLRIGDLVDADSTLNGTSTTATVALFDGRRIGVGHIGDSRAYLLRDGQLAQLTHDHTFVQTLIDEGRITEAEARVHPHRNLILRALDATQEPDPDLSYVNLRPGDRLLLCSDGACGYLEDDRILALLATGSPESAAVDLVRESLEAGSTDNVTCVVADVLAEAPLDKETLLVGAAAELPRPSAPTSLPMMPSTVSMRNRFRSRMDDSGDIPLPDLQGLPDGTHPIANDPLDPEHARYAPQPPERYQWLRRLLVLVAVIGVLWVGIAAAWAWSQHQFYVGEHDGKLTIFRGINAEVPGIELSHPFQISDVEVDSLPEFAAASVREGIEASSRADAEKTLRQFAARQEVG